MFNRQSYFGGLLADKYALPVSEWSNISHVNKIPNFA